MKSISPSQKNAQTVLGTIHIFVGEGIVVSLEGTLHSWNKAKEQGYASVNNGLTFVPIHKDAAGSYRFSLSPQEVRGLRGWVGATIHVYRAKEGSETIGEAIITWFTTANWKGMAYQRETCTSFPICHRTGLCSGFMLDHEMFCPISFPSQQEGAQPSFLEEEHCVSLSPQEYSSTLLFP